MPLETIYLTRHGLRAAYTLNPHTGTYQSTTPTPTGIPTDVPLVSHGHTQAHELAAHLHTLLPPSSTAIYSSPFTRCLQTLAPVVAQLSDPPPLVRAEPGLGEWFGAAPFTHPGPATHSVLRALFPFLDPEYNVPVCVPPPTGESIAQLHDRVAYTLSGVIEALDRDPRQPRVLLVCTHAATLIAAGRALTGRGVPEEEGGEEGEQDFKAFTAGVSVFVRGEGGKGVGGGWECVRNSNCGFLSGGEERGWHFSGDESFPGAVEVSRSSLSSSSSEPSSGSTRTEEHEHEHEQDERQRVEVTSSLNAGRRDNEDGNANDQSGFVGVERVEKGMQQKQRRKEEKGDSCVAGGRRSRL